MINTAYKGKCW